MIYIIDDACECKKFKVEANSKKDAYLRYLDTLSESDIESMASDQEIYIDCLDEIEDLLKIPE